MAGIQSSGAMSARLHPAQNMAAREILAQRLTTGWVRGATQAQSSLAGRWMSWYDRLQRLNSTL